MPTVSVILPAYNSQRYIESAVRSILTQTFRDFEFIIVNDGSTDSTEAILKRLAHEDNRIRLISRPNTGYVRALIEAAGVSSGEFIARMDGDDLALPDRFARQVEYLRANPNVNVVGSWYDLIDEQSRRLHTQTQPTDNAGLQRACLAGTTPICHPTAMFRRSAYEQLGGYDESYCPAEDLDLWLRLGEMGQLGCIDHVLLKYRLHDKSVSETRQQTQIDSARRACEAAAKRRGIALEFNAGQGWRESGSGKNRQILKYGWWAWNCGEKTTARSYGWTAVQREPFSSRAWKLLLCSYLKSPPEQTSQT